MLIGLMNAQKVCAQVSAQKWAGHTPAQVAGAQAGSNDALFYLYNVGTGLYLSQGGVWGTCAVVSEAGIQFQRMTSVTNLTDLTGAYNLKTFVGSNAGANYVNFSNGINLQSPGYFFLDQYNTNGDKDFRYTSSFVFTKVSEGVYTIYATSKEGESNYKGTFYLSVDDDNTCYGKQRTDANDKAVATTITDNDKWIIVTKTDIINNFENTEGTTANPAYAPHLVYDAGFYREDTNVKNWAMGEKRSTNFDAANYYFYTVGEDGKITGTNTKGNSSYNEGLKPIDAIPSTSEVIINPATYIYTVECTYEYQGWTQTYSDSHTIYDVPLYTDYGETAELTGDLCIKFEKDKAHTVKDALGVSHPAALTKQVLTKTGSTPASTQTVTNAGYTYYIGNGYNMHQTSGKFEDGKTYSGTYYQEPFGGYWTANIHGTKGSISQQITPGRKGWWKVSAKGFSNDGTGYLFAYAGTTNQPNTDKYQIQPFNTVDTVATGINTYVKASKYLNTTESQSVTVYVGETDNLIFGAYIQNGKADSWTCFDDFTLAYLGKGELNLIIDEENEEIANINDQMIPDKNQTLRLTRSFKTNQWNSLVLPVNLTAQQVKTAFGADTKLSYLHETSPDGKRIFFEKVDLSVDDADAIEAGKLYIIKPQNAMPEKQNVKERTFENRTKITSSDSYYTINQVSLTRSDLIADVEETDFVPSTEDNGIKMVGTYVKKGTAVAGGTQAIPAYSYILGTPKNATDSKWYYTTVAVNNVKGLRGWLETGKSAHTTDVKFFMNGVEEGEVTAIEGIESSMEVSKRINSNIYNLNGQLVRSNSVSAEGLDKGIYIIGGKKVVVK